MVRFAVILAILLIRKIQMPRPHLRPVKSGYLEWGPRHGIFVFCVVFLLFYFVLSFLISSDVQPGWRTTAV